MKFIGRAQGMCFKCLITFGVVTVTLDNRALKDVLSKNW
jgi:hypothetical protein